LAVSCIVGPGVARAPVLLCPACRRPVGPDSRGACLRAGEDFPEEEFFDEMPLPFYRIEALIFLYSGLYVMRIEDLRSKRREEILEIAARHGARNVRIFGSVARGEADSKSDLDLLVEFLPGSTLLNQSAMIRELESFLKVKVDVVSDQGLRERIRERILAEAVPL